MKILKTILLIFTFNLLLNGIAYAESTDATEKAAQDKKYEDLAKSSFSGKRMFEYIDYPSLSKDSNPLSPINWPGKLKDWTLKERKGAHSMQGQMFLWEVAGFTGTVNFATYISAREARIALADVLGHIPVRLSKGASKGISVGDASFLGTSNIYFVRKNFYIHLTMKGKYEPKVFLSMIEFLAEDIDKTILDSKTPLLVESMPFTIKLSKKSFKVKNKVSLEVKQLSKDRNFKLICEKIKGDAAIAGKLRRRKKTDMAQGYDFEAVKSGNGVLKVYICEESGLIWTACVDFNASL